MNTKYAFILTFLAGISTLIGTIPIFTRFDDKIANMAFKMSFISLLIISILELIPDSYKLLENKYLIIFSVLIGFITVKILDHRVGKGSTYFKISIISIISMIMHNIPEGIITFITTTYDFKLGVLIGISIMFHNIPEGLIIAAPIYKYKKSRGLALLLTLVSGLSEFLGALLSFWFLSKYINNNILGIMYSYAAGIMIGVCVYELLPVIRNKICIENR